MKFWLETVLSALSFIRKEDVPGQMCVSRHFHFCLNNFIDGDENEMLLHSDSSQVRRELNKTIQISGISSSHLVK